MELDSLHVTVNVHTRPSEEFDRVARALGYAPTDCDHCVHEFSDSGDGWPCLDCRRNAPDLYERGDAGC